MTQRPQDLVFTLFGEHFLHREQAVWVGSLIALLRPFDVTEGSVRTVLSRMARKGWLDTRKDGRHSSYFLTRRGRKLLEEGEQRILHPRWGTTWDGRWYLVTYSIPENIRKLRDRLRVRLSWLGFGSLGNGMWISPHDAAPEIRELSKDMDLEGHLLGFRTSEVDGVSDEELVSRCWDLPALAAEYRAFLERWRPRLRASGETQAKSGRGEETRFVQRFNLMHEFRSFPLRDPYLPEELLPEGWPGQDAAELFTTLHDRLRTTSNEYVDAILAEDPTGHHAREAAMT